MPDAFAFCSKNLKFCQKSCLCPMDSVIICDNSCNATNVNVFRSISLFPSFVVFKQNAIFSPLFSLKAVNSLVGSVSLIFVGLNPSTSFFTRSSSGCVYFIYLTIFLHFSVTVANKFAANSNFERSLTQ